MRGPQVNQTRVGRLEPLDEFAKPWRRLLNERHSNLPRRCPFECRRASTNHRRLIEGQQIVCGYDARRQDFELRQIRFDRVRVRELHAESRSRVVHAALVLNPNSSARLSSLSAPGVESLPKWARRVSPLRPASESVARYAARFPMLIFVDTSRHLQSFAQFRKSSPGLPSAPSGLVAESVRKLQEGVCNLPRFSGAQLDGIAIWRHRPQVDAPAVGRNPNLHVSACERLHLDRSARHTTTRAPPGAKAVAVTPSTSAGRRRMRYASRSATVTIDSSRISIVASTTGPEKVMNAR